MKKTVKEKLMVEFECAINAVFGSLAEKECDLVDIDARDLEAIKNKVAFYLDIK